MSHGLSRVPSPNAAATSIPAGWAAPLGTRGQRCGARGAERAPQAREGTPSPPFSSSTAQPLASGRSPHSRGSAAHPAPAPAPAEAPCAAGSGCSSPPERGGGVKPAGAASPCARRAAELAPFSPAGYFYPAPLGFAPSFSTSLPGVALLSRSPSGSTGAEAPGPGTRREGRVAVPQDPACRSFPAPSAHPSAHAWHPHLHPSRSSFPELRRTRRDRPAEETRSGSLGSLPAPDAADCPLFFLQTSPPSLFRSSFLPSFQPVPGGSSAASRRCLLSRRLRLSVHPPLSSLPFPPRRPALDDAAPAPFFCSLSRSLSRYP